MTIQTKHFIEVSDLVGLRFECKDCGATLTLSPKQKLKGSIEKCPSCHHSWAVLNDSSYEPAFTRFTDTLNQLNQILAGPNPAPIGFLFTLEIKQALGDWPIQT